MSDSQNLAFNRVPFPRIYWKRRMFYSKPLASLPLTEFPSSSPPFLSLPLSLSFPFSTTVNTEQARARHVSRHNHRALSGMIKFSTARLTEFPSSQEKSCESRERERQRGKGKYTEKREASHSLSRLPLIFPCPDRISRFATLRDASNLISIGFPRCSPE